MTPVAFLSDAFLANGAEPWPIPDPADLPRIGVPNRTEKEGFYPYLRDPLTLARPWAVPGTPGLEHRIGGLEKADVLGNVSYDPENHHRMTVLRDAKIAGIAKDIPARTCTGRAGELLILAGLTCGAHRSAVERLPARGAGPATPPPPEPFPAEPGRRAQPATGRCWSRKINLGQLLIICAGTYRGRAPTATV
jgi:2-oxoglutarate ferredoxin oxidoreductase subunit alpha